MANPFVKGWKYLMALFGAKIDEHADPKVQIQQAIEDAQRQHQALVQQAAAVIGNQRQLEMKLSRQMSEVEQLQASARQALVLADQARAEGDEAKASRVRADRADLRHPAGLRRAARWRTSRSLHDQALGAAEQARKAVENNAMLLQQKLAERTKLLSQLEQAKMQETVATSLESMSLAGRAGQHAVAGRGPGEDRAAVRQRAGPGRARLQLGRGPDARGAEVDAGHGRRVPAGADPGQHGRRPVGRRTGQASGRGGSGRRYPGRLEHGGCRAAG